MIPRIAMQAYLEARFSAFVRFFLFPRISTQRLKQATNNKSPYHSLQKDWKFIHKLEATINEMINNYFLAYQSIK